MSQMIISAAQLESKRERLSALSRTMHSQIGQLEQVGNSLDSMWEGAAKESFKKSLKADLAKIKLFFTIVSAMLTILEKIISLYKKMESQNIATANS